MKTCLAGVVDLREKKADRAILEGLISRARLPIPAVWSCFQGTGASIAGGLVHPEACSDPAADYGARKDGVCVFMDGTLDNRRELARELGWSPERNGAISQPNLIAAAYRRWGDECVGRFLGGFAFLLWDEKERRLLAARDPLGIRTLFYTERSGRLLVSSQALQIVPAGALSLSILREEYFSEFLASQETVERETPFRDIFRLEAAHLLAVDGGRLKMRRYWDFDNHREIRYKSEAEYAEHFLELFEEAVCRSLDTGGKVWSELSGGLDSSGIVSMAKRIFDSRPDLDKGFETLSLVWDQTAQCDERRWSRPVTQETGFPSHEIPCDDLVFDGAREGAFYRDEPHHGLILNGFGLAEGALLRRFGVSALLSGARAECVVLPEAPPPLHLADLLQSFRLVELRRELLAWQKNLSAPLSNLLHLYCLGPLLNPTRTHRSLFVSSKLPDWITEDFRRRTDMGRRVVQSSRSRRFRRPSAQYHYQLISGSEQMVQRGYLDWVVELRYPFLYRPLAEFSLAIPWQAKIRPGVHKALFRDAMKGILPEVVRVRRGKRGPGASIYKAFAAKWPQVEPLVRDPILAELGIVDRDQFYRGAQLARHGSARRFVDLGAALSLEYWLRTIFGDAAAQRRAS